MTAMLEVFSDNSAARWQTRHVESPHFWVQDRIREGHVKILPVRSNNFPEALFTVAVNGKLQKKLLNVLRSCTLTRPSNTRRYCRVERLTVHRRSTSNLAECFVRSVKSLKAAGDLSSALQTYWNRCERAVVLMKRPNARERVQNCGVHPDVNLIDPEVFFE